MNLKDFLANRDPEHELYWSLVMEPGWVQAGLWFIKDDEASVVSVGPASPWETEEDLIGATDAALSSTVQKLPESANEPSKTVFGVPAAWVSGGEIKEEYLDKIKKVCTELSLEPVGFVVLPEAIAHLYKSEEGSPVSAIVVGLGKEFLEVTVFKLGNLVGTTTVARSVSVVEDVVEGLSRFQGAEPLPSRFIVYDGREGEVEEARDALLSADWGNEGKIKFLHTPKVEAIISDRKVFATSLAGASEIGHASHVSTDEKNEKETQEKISEDLVNIVEPENPPSAADLGFAIGEDISKSPQPVVDTTTSQQRLHSPIKIEKVFQAPAALAKIKSLFHSLSGKISFKPKVNGQFNKNRLYISLGVLIVFLIALLAFWWFYPKATVLVFVNPKSYDNSTQINVAVDGVSDLTNGIIPGRVLDAKVSGTKTASATGSKLIGDKAKGPVTIGNTTANSINLAIGTILSSTGNLNFLTDNEASISAATDSFHPGTVTVSVTAADIGAQYNLARGEVFTVGNYSKTDVSAQSTSDFSGGTSSQILAVSQSDQDSLEKSLTAELTSKAVDNVTSQGTDIEVVAPDLVSIDKTNENFSAKVGDQAQTLQLDLTLDAKAIAVDKAKLIEFAKNLLKDKVPDGFVLKDDQISFKFTFNKLKGGRYNFDVAISANFLPTISTNQIINQISGKTSDAAETYLSQIPGFNHAEVKIVSPFPSFLRVLPEVPGNINLEIVGEKP